MELNIVAIIKFGLVAQKAIKIFPSYMVFISRLLPHFMVIHNQILDV